MNKITMTLMAGVMVLPLLAANPADTQKEWQAREVELGRGGMNANEKRAFSFTRRLEAQKQSLRDRAKVVGVVLPKERRPTTVESMAHLKYQRGSMSPREMDGYEQAEMAKYGEAERPVAAVERAAQLKWRQEHPLEARMADIEAAAHEAESVAVMAQIQADDARQQAQRASEDAQAAKIRADDAVKRAKDAEWRTQDLEFRSRQP